MFARLFGVDIGSEPEWLFDIVVVLALTLLLVWVFINGRFYLFI